MAGPNTKPNHDATDGEQSFFTFRRERRCRQAHVVEGNGHADILQFAEHSTLPLTKPGPLRSIQRGKLNVQEGKVALSPPFPPLIDQQREQPSVLADSRAGLGVRFSLIPNDSANRVRNQRLDPGGPYETGLEGMIGTTRSCKGIR